MSGFFAGTINGKPCWSPSARTRSADFGTACDPEEQRLALLAEAADLVRAGVRAGLVQPAEAPKPVKPPKTEKYGAGWRTINCEKCGISFYRGHVGITKCGSCRLGTRVCFCGKEFQPLQNKAQSCSPQCAKARQIASFKARHGADTKPVILAECIICHQMRPRRQAGATFAKTCSKECASVYRKLKSTDSNQFRAKNK